jgi:hypothetical protein
MYQLPDPVSSSATRIVSVPRGPPGNRRTPAFCSFDFGGQISKIVPPPGWR